MNHDTANEMPLGTRLKLLLGRWTHKQDQTHETREAMVKEDLRSRDTDTYAKLQERELVLQELRSELLRTMEGEMPPGLNIAWHLSTPANGFTQDPVTVMRSVLEQAGYNVDPATWAALELQTREQVAAGVRPIFQVDYRCRKQDRDTTVKIQVATADEAREYVEQNLGEVTGVTSV